MDRDNPCPRPLGYGWHPRAQTPIQRPAEFYVAKLFGQYRDATDEAEQAWGDTRPSLP